jgi:Asp/Glu/hydantoin racemase
MFSELTARIVPEAKIEHVVDSDLIQNTIAAGKLERKTMRRVVALVNESVEAGADAVVVTCSSIGPAVDIAAQLHDIPVLRIDRPMAEKAVASGKRIGVAATLSTTLNPTADLVRKVAADQGKTVEIIEHLCEGAFEAVMAGDGATHDKIVGEGLINGLADVDVIVLAQASMARVLNTLPEGAVKVPVYSSPELGIERARDVLKSTAS